MYRDPGALPYGPLAKRVGLLWRLLAVLCGASAFVVGLVIAAWLVLLLSTGKGLVGADLLIPFALPIALGVSAYGVDLVVRAIRVRSTDRSAFEGTNGRKRAIVGVIGAGYVLSYVMTLAFAVGRVEPGVDVFLGLLAFIGVAMGASSARGLLRARAIPPTAFVPTALRVAEAPPAVRLAPHEDEAIPAETLGEDEESLARRDRVR